MFEWKSPAEWKRVVRYYQAGVVNTGFGYGCFAALVALGMNIYGAQILAHIAGMAFNYLTYSHYAFRGHRPALGRYLGSYGVNYLLSLGSLAALVHFGLSPYVAGLGSIFAVSIVNYFVLKLFVYRTQEA